MEWERLAQDNAGCADLRRRQPKPWARLCAACLLVFAAVLAASLAANLAAVRPVHAQVELTPTPVPQEAISAGKGWQPQRRIPEYYDMVVTPILIADQNRTVHAFASRALTDDPADPDSKEWAIYYRQWTLENGWTSPTDILLAPVKSTARVKGVFLDKAGVFHLVFFGGDDTQNGLFYTSAPATQAASARAWATPVMIGEHPSTPDQAGLVGDGEGNMIAMYSGDLGEGNSLYAIYTTDGGATWSDPALIWSSYAKDQTPMDFTFTVGESGKIYLTFNVSSTRGQNLGGYFTRLDSFQDREWKPLIPIDQNRGLGIANNSLIEYKGQLFLIYNNGVEGKVPPQVWFRQSSDYGDTWSQPIVPFPDMIGRNGIASFTVDSNGSLRMFWGQRIPFAYDGTLDLHGMWYSDWNGNMWGPAQFVTKGPSGLGYDPSDPHAVVVNGNLQLVTWMTDPGNEVRGTFYSYIMLDAPALPVVPLPTPSVSVNPAATEDILPAAALPLTLPDAAAALAQPMPVEPTIDARLASAPHEMPTNPGVPILVGLAPALLLSGVVFSLALAQRRRRV